MNAQMVTIQVAPQVAAILDTLQKRAEAEGVVRFAGIIVISPSEVAPTQPASAATKNEE
jgi:hypothetical protein